MLWRYILFTIDNPDFEKYIPDIYPTDFQLNKANASDKNFFPGFKYSTVSNNVLLSNLIKGMFNSNPSVKTLLKLGYTACVDELMWHYAWTSKGRDTRRY